MGSHVAMVQQHRSVLAQHTFPFEGRELEDEVGRGRSGNDGIPQESFADRVGSEKDEDGTDGGVGGMKNRFGGSCDAKSKTGRQGVRRLW
jgi:hypothetical protein